MTTCPRCGEAMAPGQEYCLECGLRIQESGLSRGPDPGSGWFLRVLVAAVVALAGAGAAVGVTSGGSEHAKVNTAIGGFATLPTAGTLPGSGETGPSGVADWPPGEDGWTIALASLPQTGGRRPAVTRARQARKAGLPEVGVLDSSRYASLHPGYWIVFSGVYTSEAEATSALESARKFARAASVRRVIS